MKKIFYSLTIMAMAVFSFSSCEDVPSPFDLPNGSEDNPSANIEPAGSGTAADPYNVAAAIEFTQQLEMGEKSSSNIYIKGIVASITEEYTSQYGNATFKISDDGTAKNTFTVYRALYLNNKRFSDNDKQIQVGDEVVVCGIVTNYNGTLETDQNKAYLYSLNGVGGGGDTPGGEAKGNGTLDDPYNPAGAAAAVSSLTWTSNDDYQKTGDVYVKGKISRIADKGTFTEGGTFGNASFYISEDGTENGEFYCFRILYLGNKKFSSGKTDIKVGDEVIICGKLMNYRGNTPETVAGEAFLYSLNGQTEGGGGGGDTPAGEAKGSGTLSDPYNPAGAAAAVKNLTWTDNNTYDTTGDVYVKGKISRIADKGTFTEGGTYGNASFYISEDGKESGEFYCFRIYYLGNKKFEAGKTDIKVGDEVIVCGQLMNYRNNTPETVAGKAYLYSLNGNTEGGGGGGGGETGEVKVVSIADFNAAAVSNSVWYQLTGTVKNLKDDDKYGNFDLEDATGSVYVYGVLSEKGGEKQKFKELAAAKGITNGSKLTIIGNRGEYNGKIEVLNAYFVKVEGGSGGGGDDQPSGTTYTVTQAIAANSGSGVYVKGYIVGFVDGQAYESGARFEANGTVTTNVLIADSPSESDLSKCMPVQLPSGDVRNGVNLKDNPGNYKKDVLLFGNIETYFKVPGVKAVTYAEVGGTAYGKKPAVKRRR